MTDIDTLVENIRKFVDFEGNHDYIIRLQQEPNSNVFWVKLDKMYDEDFEPINLTSIWGDNAVKLYKSANPANQPIQGSR